MASPEQTTSAVLVRSARDRAGLTQAELAERAGVSQSVISVYESGGRNPSVTTLASLVRAAGFELEIELRPIDSPEMDTIGRLGTLVRDRREKVLATADRHGVRIRGVFGSVARSEDTADSDVDLLVDLPAGMGLFALGRVRGELEDVLAVPVDLVPFADLKTGVRDAVLHDLVPL